MTKRNTSQSSSTEGYRIGAVCRLTGLSPHVLRIWEKRYGVVTPGRSSSQRRLYTDEDVRKLSLLKTLVDRGQAIGSLISLDIVDLQRRVDESAGGYRSGASGTKIRVAVVGPSLQREAEHWTESRAFEVVSRCGEVSEF